MAKQLPTQARVVVVGGGIVGCSVAYHLAKAGWKDVILLERKVLSSGTTWAAAGLVGQLRPSAAITKLIKYGTELYAGLEEETEQVTGYIRNGSIMVAQTEDRAREFDLNMSMAHSFGVEMYRIGLDEAKDKWPLLNTKDLHSAYYLPGDGMTSPVDTAQALAKGARMYGATIFENTLVTDIQIKDGRVTGVSTDKGDVTCEYVVNCAGMWGRDVGKMVGAAVPLFAAEHMHVVTKPIEGIYKGMPTLRDYDGLIYFREEVGGLMMGGFEPHAKPWGKNGIPDNFQFTELNEDWDQFSVFLENAIQRCPAMETAEIRHLTSVPESFTPDNAYYLGEYPGIKGFFMSCGMNSSGVASAGGMGKAVAEWLMQGYPEEDLFPIDIRRSMCWQNNTKYLMDRISETVGTLYADHWPFKQMKTSRDVRKTPLYDRLAAKGAVFGALSGWERANWYAPEGVEAKYEYSWGRPNWFEYSAAEHMAIRDNVGIYDATTMANFLLQGKDAEKVLNNICANDVSQPIGKVVYTQMLNERGGIEADLTVIKLAEGKFFIITATATETRDFDWINKSIPGDANAVLTNVSSSYSMVAVMGPKSRDLLAKVTDADLSNEAFPYASAQVIDVDYARPLAVRMSFPGELGWELYVPCEFATGMFDAIYEAGREFDAKLVGMHAIDTLRLEKGYRHWGSDIDPDHNPYESGLGFAVRLNKGDFIGRDALLKAKEGPLTRKLVQFKLVDPEPLLAHDEAIYRNGEVVSCNTHGAYGHKIGSSLGMLYLENPEGVTDEWIMDAKYEIEIDGRMYPIELSIQPWYDPRSERVKM